MIAVWKHLYQTTKAGDKAVLMVVSRSKGSAPGKHGFKMAVSPDGVVIGTIGGGIMEHNLIESAGRDLQVGSIKNRVIQQVHHNRAPQEHQSGMICAGSQEIVVCGIEPAHNPMLETLIQAEQGQKSGTLLIDGNGFHFSEEAVGEDRQSFFRERIGEKDQVHIIGGGHVGLALSQTLEPLDFQVHVYDHRQDLATMETISCAKTITPYERLDELIPMGQYIVIVTTAWKSDAEALYRVLARNPQYIGLMGSAAKIKTIFDYLRERGVSDQQLQEVRAPAGVRIKNRTPAEIGISIAAELIDERNRRLET